MGDRHSTKKDACTIGKSCIRVVEVANLSALRALAATMNGPPKVVAQPARERRAPVPHGRELDRILALPRRAPPSDALIELMREAVTKPGADLKLWPIQAQALLAALELTEKQPSAAGRRPGLYAPIAVGGGKTLICALLGTVWAADRPVILTTAALAAQMEHELVRYRASFLVPEGLVVVSYSILSHADHANKLESLRPDALILDEGHALLGKSSARSKRIRRYLKAQPETRLAILTGTAAKRSILEWAELAGLALEHWSPAPRDRETRIKWAEALDPEDAQGSILGGRDVGALKVFK